MAVHLIESPHNPTLKKLSLRLKKGDPELFFLEGQRSVAEALKSPHFKLHSLWMTPEFYAKTPPETAAPMYLLPLTLMKKLSDTPAPQGILAVVYRQFHDISPETALENVLAKAQGRGEAPLLLLLESLQDPGNVGALIRSADAMGASAVILCGGSSDPYAPKASRASMGSILHLPLIPLPDPLSAARLLKSRGVQLLAGHLKGAKPCYEADLTKPCALMVGNEGSGLSPALSAEADQLVLIPMQGEAESLNAAMAGSILLYEARRQRLQARP